jgi:hypothetical protein
VIFSVLVFYFLKSLDFPFYQKVKTREFIKFLEKFSCLGQWLNHKWDNSQSSNYTDEKLIYNPLCATLDPVEIELVNSKFIFFKSLHGCHNFLLYHQLCVFELLNKAESMMENMKQYNCPLGELPYFQDASKQWTKSKNCLVPRNSLTQRNTFLSNRVVNVTKAHMEMS